MSSVKQGNAEADIVKETKVEVEQFRSSAGQEDATKEPISVVHLQHSTAPGGGGIMSGAASAVARSVESAKEALTGGKEDTGSRMPQHKA